jgi:hypothetical protein
METFTKEDSRSLSDFQERRQKSSLTLSGCLSSTITEKATAATMTTTTTTTATTTNSRVIPWQNIFWQFLDPTFP